MIFRIRAMLSLDKRRVCFSATREGGLPSPSQDFLSQEGRNKKVLATCKIIFPFISSQPSSCKLVPQVEMAGIWQEQRHPYTLPPA